MIQIRNIGIAFGISAGVRRFQRLEEGLAHLAGLGYRLVEMNPHSLAMIVNGAVRRDVLADFVAVLRNFDLGYTG